MELTIALLFGLFATIFVAYTTKKSTTQLVKNNIIESISIDFINIVEKPFYDSFLILVPTLDINGVQVVNIDGTLRFHKELPIQYKSVSDSFANFKGKLSLK